MKDNNLQPFIFYTTPDGVVSIEVFVQDETVWLTQKKMAELFDVQVSAISKHLKNIYNEAELDKDRTISKMEIVQKEGGRSIKRNLEYYNLDAIIAVGYRVNSKKATRFRQWATSVLRDYIIKGFALDDELLKNGTRLGKDYFRELLERVRSIRSSERRIYMQITDIFKECSIDYDKHSPVTRDFYASVQNKFHFAIHGQTAAEKIYDSVDRNHPTGGLITWKHSPDGRILKSDFHVAKNYLSEKEIKRLERTVSSYFDYIENQIEQQQTFTMESLADSVNRFLEFNNFKVLEGKGRISKDQADKKASAEYDGFNKTQKIKSDFDEFVEETKKIEKKK